MGTHKQFLPAALRKGVSYLAATLAIIVVMHACRKTDSQGNQDTQPGNVVTKFLTLPASATPEVKRIAATLKKKNEIAGFLNEMAKKDGFPVWDKVIVNTAAKVTRKGASLRTNSSNDTIVYIPLVLGNADHVNAFIYARLHDSISLQLHRANNYESYGFGSMESATDNAERLAFQFMMLDKAVFGHKKFKLMDNRLFHNASDPTNSLPNTERYLEIKEDSTSNSASRLAEGTITRCTYSVSHHCTGDLVCIPNCDNCPLCVTEGWECVTTVYYYFVDDDGSSGGGGGGTGGGTGGGGGGGGSSPTDPVPCNPNPLLDNGLLPCPEGNTTGWLPFVTTQLDDVDDTDINDPCLKSVLDNITKPGLANYISRIYNGQNFTPNTTQKYKVKYEIDTTLVGSTGQPVPGNTTVTTAPDGTHQVSIKLNTKLFQGSTKEWATAVVLHEMMHGIVAVLHPEDSTTNLAHIGMFERKSPIYIMQSLKEIFPSLDDHDAIALGMDGLGLPGIFMIPDPNNPGGTMIDPNRDLFALTNYYQSISQAVSAFTPYHSWTGSLGTQYCN